MRRRRWNAGWERDVSRVAVVGDRVVVHGDFFDVDAGRFGFGVSVVAFFSAFLTFADGADWLITLVVRIA